ncbi:MAG: hypothetical protein E7505_06715 [Ruminococcus sp.]|nr:hypothetical protein [Ruminococcus sp.]
MYLRTWLSSVWSFELTYIKAGCIIDVGFQPQSSSNVAVVEEMKENGVEFNFICNKLNDNIANYEALSSDGSHIEWKPDFADIIIDKVSAYGSDVISYYYGTGLFSNVCLTSDISYDWYRVAKGELTDEEIIVNVKINLTFTIIILFILPCTSDDCVISVQIG